MEECYNYKNGVKFSVTVKTIIALEFVPIEDLEVVIDLFTYEFQDCPLLEWFEEYYIRRKKSKKSGSSITTILTSNLEFISNQNRTNNHVEAANMNVRMEVTNTTIGSFINCLKKVQSGRYVFL